MIENIRNTYQGGKVKLDNNNFIECTFKDCTLEFSGKGPVGLEKCTFSNVEWVFGGSAQLTLQFLQSMYHGMGPGGQKIVEGTFENIRRAQ